MQEVSDTKQLSAVRRLSIYNDVIHRHETNRYHSRLTIISGKTPVSSRFVTGLAPKNVGVHHEMAR